MNKTYRVTQAYTGNMNIEAFESGKKVLDIIVIEELYRLQQFAKNPLIFTENEIEIYDDYRE